MNKALRLLFEIRQGEYIAQVFKVRIFHDDKWHEYETTVTDVQPTAAATYEKALKNVLWSKKNNISNPKQLWSQLKEDPNNYSVNLKHDITMKRK